MPRSKKITTHVEEQKVIKSDVKSRIKGASDFVDMLMEKVVADDSYYSTVLKSLYSDYIYESLKKFIKKEKSDRK